MKKSCFLISCLFLPLPVQGEGANSKELLCDGLFEEEVNRDYGKAEATYLSLLDHLPPHTLLVDSSKIVLRRGEAEPIRMGPAHDRGKIRLMDGDVIEYSLRGRDDDSARWDAVQIFFPDCPANDGRYQGDVPLSEILHNVPLPGGRDFSKLEIQRMGEEGMESIPVDLLAITRESLHEEATVAKALELLGTKVLPGDVVVFPPKQKVPWPKRCRFDAPAAWDSQISAVVSLVKPAPRVVPTTIRPKFGTRVRRVPLPPTSR